MPESPIDDNLPIAVAGTVGAVVGGGIAATLGAPVVIIGGTAVASAVAVGAAVYKWLK